MKSGNDVFEDYNKEITCFYGEPSSGKTTFAMLASISAAKDGKKVVYIDTEGGFNVERFKQLSGNSFKTALDNILLFRPKRFSEQNKIIRNFENMKNIFLIVIDTLSYFYREKVNQNPKVYNMWVARQLGILKEMSKDSHVIITNQVYNNISKNKIEMVGGEMVRRYFDKIIFLEKEPRKLVFEASDIKINFKIFEDKIVKDEFGES